jgi:hypothetical protein
MGQIKVCGSIYSPSESAILYAQVLDDAGNPVSTAIVTLDLFKSDGTKYLDSKTMSYISGSNGLYKYSFIAPSEIQRMIADVKSTNPSAYGIDEIYVADWTKGIDDLVSGTEPPSKASFVV